MKTNIRKGIRGWVADTAVDLGNQRELRFTTMKRSNGALVTTVRCGEAEGNMFSYTMFQDFNVRLISEVVRVTEKAVADQHKRALGMLDEVKAQCEAFYQKGNQS